MQCEQVHQTYITVSQNSYGTVNIDIPNATFSPVNLIELLSSDEFRNNNYGIPVCIGMDASGPVIRDIETIDTGSIPRQLQNKHYDGEGNAEKGQNYLYPHDYPNHYVVQQYLPDNIKDKKYYEYANNKNEQAAKEYWDKIKKNAK